MHPCPASLGDVLNRYDTVVAPEMNLGLFALLLRARFLVDVQSATKMMGLAFSAGELST